MKKGSFVGLICVAVLLVASATAYFWYLKKSSSGNVSQPETKASVSEANTGAVVIPHFDFAENSRQKFLSGLSAKGEVKKIILFSVNHFDSSADFISSKKQWNLVDQTVDVDGDFVDWLSVQNLTAINDNVFVGEHGITNVIGEVQQSFSEAKIAPVIVKPNVKKEKLDSFITAIYQKCPECYLVGSVDFSHYLPSSLAQIHDQTTIDAIASLDGERILNCETDSPEILYMLNWWAKENGLNFKLYENSSSGLAQKNYDMETTSWVIGEYARAEAQAAKVTSFLFGGDIMLDRMVNHVFKDEGFEKVFSDLGERTFLGSDIKIANLEGPISASAINDDISTNNLSFNFAPESIKALNFLKFNFLSLSNNHTQNAGVKGLQNTIDTLTANGIEPIGSQTGFDQTNIVRSESGGTKVSIIAVNTLSVSSEEKFLEAARQEKDAGRYVIFFPHWGNEYNETHSSAQQQLAHKMIDAGTDLIIGSHPHVIQDSEVYNGKLIVYSLGNFVFDQTFSTETQQGVLVGGTVEEGKLRVSFFPIEIKNYKPRFLRDSKRQAILDHVLPAGISRENSDTIILK